MLKLTYIYPVYLRGNRQFHSGFSYDKKSLANLSDETQNFKTILFCVFIYGKSSYNLISLNKKSFRYFHKKICVKKYGKTLVI